jgi:hypothetical protein
MDVVAKTNAASIFRGVRKIEKSHFSFVISVSLSVRMEQLGFHLSYFH